MSFPCKENLIYFEGLGRKQTQIYDDACDVGCIVSNEERAVARTNLLALMDFYGGKVEKWANGSITKVCIPVEYEGLDYYCIILTVDFHIDRRKKIQFLSVEEELRVLVLDEMIRYYNFKAFGR